MNPIIFVLVFLLIVNRYWIRSLLEGFSKKEKAKDLRDQRIISFIRDKTGLSLKKIKLMETKTTWAMMAGMPSMPYLIISNDAFKNFSKDEFQWLLLHEAGHYVLWHNVKMIVLQLGFIAIGASILFQFNILILALFVGVLFAVLNTQIVRKFEYEANYYALARMDNPKGLKNMYRKAKDRWSKKGKKRDNLLQKLFSVWILDIYRDLVKKASITHSTDL